MLGGRIVIQRHVGSIGISVIAAYHRAVSTGFLAYNKVGAGKG
jgi:hypothetical protein